MKLIWNNLIAAAACAITLASSALVKPQEAPTGPQFVILFSEPIKSYEDRTNQNAQAYWKKWTDYIGGIQASGKMSAGSALTHPDLGLLLDEKGLGSISKRGPIVSGFLVISAKNLEEAKQIGMKSPAIEEGGSVQVRPVLPMEQHKAGQTGSGQTGMGIR